MAHRGLDFDPDTLGIPSGHFIGGSLVNAGESQIDVCRPSDGRVMGQIPDACTDTVDCAVQSSLSAFRTSDWGRRPPRDRARVLQRWADLILSDSRHLARLEAAGSTRPIAECQSHDVPFTADAIRFFAELADKLGGDVLPTQSDHLGLLVPEPYGVVGAIAPWNFPLSMVSWKCGPALAAGNAVVLKPSELTPFTALRMAQLAMEAGMPAGILNVLNGRGHSAGADLVRHPSVAKVTFTGSTTIGASVMCDAARSGIKPVTLELGGKSPQLVFDDAGDLSEVANRIVRSILSNAGQGCVAGSRLIAQRGIAQELTEAILCLMKNVEPGPTWFGKTNFSPIINAKQAGEVDSCVRQTVAAGAELLTGGRYFDQFDGGFFYQPTVLASVTAEMPAVQREIFGPVLSIETFDDIEEGISLADHPTYGLAAGVHTRDLRKAMLAMRRIAAGTIWINRYGRTNDFIVPTGGFKSSGMGKDLGRQAVEANLRYKSVLMSFADSS